ncbi:MAG: ATP-binding protein [Bacillota bacterium]|nr:ATP-binding protein [Bacillota bacterium]
MGLLRRISRSYLFLILLTSGLVGAASLLTARSYLVRQGEADLEARLEVVAESLAAPLAAGERGPALERQVVRLGRLAQARLTVITPDGTVLADSEAPAATLGNHAGRPEVRQALAAGTGRATRWSATLDAPMLYAARLVRSDPATPAAVVRLAISLTSQARLLRRLAANILLAALAAAALSAGAGYLLARALARPVTEMSRVAKRMAAGDLGCRVYAGLPGELGELAESLNNLAREFTAMLAQTEEERREVEAVLKSLSDVVIATDARGRIALFNAAAERAFQVEEKQALGQPVLAVARLASLAEGFSAVLAGEPAEVKEIATTTPAERLYEAHLAPVRRPDGTISGAVAVLHDVTEIRRLERVRSEFVANVSHELRTPLTSLQGFVETLQDGAADDPATLHRFLGIIAAETARLARLVDDLLDLSRLESGLLALRSSPVDLGALIQRTLAFYEPAAQAKRVTLEAAVPPDLPPVPGDEDLLEQVLRNLVDNAVKYTPEGGRVEVAAEQVSYPDRRREVVVRVADTGPGIPPEHLPRLFERFYRVDRARSRQLGGTGLGLAIVKHIVERHGGRVWLESAPGAGARFSVALPLP